MQKVRNGAAQEQGMRKGMGEGRRGVNTTPSASGKAEKACMEYAHNAAMIRQAGKEIGRYLRDCPGTLGTLQNWKTFPGTSASMDDETHMSAFYAAVKEGHWVAEADQALQACPHCSAARQIVEDRKTYRQRLGAAKRAIIVAAKAIHAEANLPDPDEQARQLFLAAQGDLFQHQGGASA